MPYRFKPDGMMQTAGNLHTLIEILNPWYKQDSPDRAISYEHYMTTTALCFHLLAADRYPPYVKKPFFAESNRQKAEVYLRHDPDGATIVAKPWDLLDFLADNIDIDVLAGFRSEQHRLMKERFSACH
jgi:hypothetical protein